MKRLLVIGVAFLFVFSGICFAETASNSFDGKTFVGEMAKRGAITGDPDSFIFADGKFRSTACDKYGYTSADYTANTVGGNTVFTATTSNEEGAKLSWTGTLRGNEISGTALMTTSAGTPGDSYWFKGSLKK